VGLATARELKLRHPSLSLNVVEKENNIGMVQSCFKVCLYRTRLRLGGVREGMVEIKQTKVVHTERDCGTRL